MMDVPVGWKVLDADGNVVQQGEVTVIEIDMVDEITQRMAELVAYAEEME